MVMEASESVMEGVPGIPIAVPDIDIDGVPGIVIEWSDMAMDDSCKMPPSKRRGDDMPEEVEPHIPSCMLDPTRCT